MTAKMSENFSPLHHAMLANGQRLARDAAFLADDGRFASAFFLAVLAVEEVGKAVLDHWNSTEALPKAKGWTMHLQKQAAVSCLLIAAYAIKEHSNAFTIRTKVTGGLVAQLVKAFDESAEGRLFAHIKNSHFDKTKQMAVYLDNWEPGSPPHVDRFDDTDVQSILSLFDRALEEFHTPAIMWLGRVFYAITFLNADP